MWGFLFNGQSRVWVKLVGSCECRSPSLHLRLASRQSCWWVCKIYTKLPRTWCSLWPSPYPVPIAMLLKDSTDAALYWVPFKKQRSTSLKHQVRFALSDSVKRLGGLLDIRLSTKNDFLFFYFVVKPPNPASTGSAALALFKSSSPQRLQWNCMVTSLLKSHLDYCSGPPFGPACFIRP